MRFSHKESLVLRVYEKVENTEKERSYATKMEEKPEATE